MAQPAYRKASELTWLWLLIGLAGVAAQLGTLFLLSKTALGERLGLWIVLIAGLPMVLALVFGAWLLLRFKRQRIGVIAARLGAAGLRVAAKPSAAEQEEFAAPLRHLFPTLSLQNGPAGIQWCCAHGTDAAAFRLFEHEHTTGSGKTTQTHPHTVAAWPAGHPEIGDAALASAPWVMVARTSWLLRRVTREHESKHPAFADLAKNWAIRGDDATGQRFLTPAVRAQLAQSAHGEAWCVGAGWVCCSSNGFFTAEQLDRFLAHARGVLAATRR